MKKDAAISLLKQHIKSENMIKHCLASGAVMRALAAKLGEDEDIWQAAGILHDIDLEVTAGSMARHAVMAGEMLAGLLPEEAIAAIIAHNEHNGARARSTKFDHALAAGETITGLITAISYVYPDRKVGSVKVKSITKRMKEKAFAASVKRENILECEKLGLTLDDFAALALGAMQEISDELGL